MTNSAFRSHYSFIFVKHLSYHDVTQNLKIRDFARRARLIRNLEESASHHVRVLEPRRDYLPLPGAERSNTATEEQKVLTVTAVAVTSVSVDAVMNVRDNGISAVLDKKIVSCRMGSGVQPGSYRLQLGECFLGALARTCSPKYAKVNTQGHGEGGKAEIQDSN